MTEQDLPMATMDWNARFADPDYVFGRAASQFVVRNEPMLPRGSTVLCIADGEGRNSVYLAQHGHTVDANDFAANAIAKARVLAAEADVTVAFDQVDLSTWDWPEARYDAVFAVFIQFAPPAFRDRVFDGLRRVVKPGGMVLLHGYPPKQLEYRTGGPSNIEHLYTPDLLRDRFNDFEILVLETYEAHLEEGAGHSGQSALIDLVARRPAPQGK